MPDQVFARFDPSPDGPVSLAWWRGADLWREVREPGADLSDLPPEARAVIEALWTPDLIAASKDAEGNAIRDTDQARPDELVPVLMQGLNDLAGLVAAQAARIEALEKSAAQ